MAAESPAADPYLASTQYIDWHHPDVRQQAERLAQSTAGGTAHEITKACFEWVRDRIDHCIDAQRGPVVLPASAVLQAGVGYCYSKAHLLAALLRANGLRAGLCYQRLRLDGPSSGLCLHGLNAVWLDDGWYRLDPRGNKPGVNAQFCPPTERLAFALEHPNEVDLEGVFSTPLAAVIDALEGQPDWDVLLKSLPA